MRVLVIGSGSIGQRHMSSLRILRKEVTFDVLREGERNSRGLPLWAGVTISTSLEEALDKKPMLMVIANPSALHMRYILAAISHGIPFYAEKPLLTDRDELRQLVLYSQNRELPPNMIGCNLRFLPSLRYCKSMLERGDLGNLIHASFEAGQWLPDWRPSQDYRAGYSARKLLGGGVLLDLIHEVDAVRWLVGEINQVHAQFWHGSSLDIETEDCACLLLKAECGPVISVQLDYVSRQPFRRYRMVGDQATVEWDLPAKRLSLADAQGIRNIGLSASAFDVSATYLAAMSELLNAMDSGQPTSQPLSEGIASLELILRAKAQFNE